MQDQDAKPLIVLMHGNRKVSTKNLARQIGAKSVEPCAPEVANRHSGYLVGGTSPFGTRRQMPVFIESTILELARIAINGGGEVSWCSLILRCACSCCRPVQCSARWQNSVPPGVPRARCLQGAVLNTVYPLLAAVAAYLLGSLSFAVIVTRVMGLSDPRTYGSKNPGATNVLRSGSKAAAVLTLLLDAVKGWLPVFAVRVWGAPYGMEEGTMALVGVAAFLGHLWPVFFRFEGGKGVATALGVVVGVSGWLGLAAGTTWIIVAFFFRYSSLASLVAAVFAPVYYLIASGVVWYADARITLALGVMAMLLAWRHKDNIRRLLEGKESRLGSKSAGARGSS